jgi:hypothetical protein
MLRLFLLYLGILIVIMIRSGYSVLLCCSVYCLCVNVYCTAATGCQPNCSELKTSINIKNAVSLFPKYIKLILGVFMSIKNSTNNIYSTAPLNMHLFPGLVRSSF